MALILVMCLTCACAKAQKNNAAVSPGDSLSTVYFTKEVSAQAVLKIYQHLAQEMGNKIAIKVHFGEDGNTNYLPASLVKDLCQSLNATLVETNVLYGGKRGSTESHLALARKHGFDFAPIDILDSEANLAYNVKTKHFSKVYTGSHFPNYDSYVIFTHFKGHGSAGFGGAIKNVSMGLASKEGKRFMHSGDYPIYDEAKCIQCGLCIKECPEQAISIKPVNIDHLKCIACGKCTTICPQKVFSFPDNNERHPAFLERLVEYTKVLSEQKKMVYINVLAKINRGCDCASQPMKPFVADIGIMASTDIVAIEAASHDMVDKAHKCEDAFLKENSLSGKHQINYAHQLGMGNIGYKIVDIDKDMED